MKTFLSLYIPSFIIISFILFFQFHYATLKGYINHDNKGFLLDLHHGLVAGLLLKEGKGEDIFDIQKQKQTLYTLTDVEYFLPFRYLPFVSFLYLPFVFLTTNKAIVAFFLFNLLTLTFCTFLLVKIFPFVRKLPLWFLLPYIFYPTFITLSLGQLSLVLLLIFILLLQFLKIKNYFVLGLVASLLSIKIQYLPFIPFLFLVIENKKTFLRGFIISSTFLFVLSLIASGPGFIYKYPAFVLSTENANFGTHINYIYSTNSILSRMPYPLSSIKLIILINFVFLVFFFGKLKFLAGTLAVDRFFSACVVLIVVFSSHTMSTDLIVLLIPMFLLLDRYFCEEKVLDLLLVFLILVLPYISYLPIVNTQLSPVFLIFLFFYLVLSNGRAPLISRKTRK